MESHPDHESVQQQPPSVFAVRGVRDSPEDPAAGELPQAEQVADPPPASPQGPSGARFPKAIVWAAVCAAILATAFVLSRSHGRSVDRQPEKVALHPVEDIRSEALSARLNVGKLLALATELHTAEIAREGLAAATMTASGAQSQFDAGNIAGALAAWQEAEKTAGQAVLKTLRQRHETRLVSAHLNDIPGIHSPASSRLAEKVAAAEKSAGEGDFMQAAALYREADDTLADMARDTAGQLERLADGAAERQDTAMALVFYGQLIRLDPGNSAARAFLYRNRFKPGETTRNAAGMTFAYIPPGQYRQGSPESEIGHHHDETQREVTLSRGFFLGVTEVTQAQWDAVMGAGDAARRLAALHETRAFVGADLPMHSVRWDEAVAFCRALSALDGKKYRLPTEAEWEYACRAGTTSAFNTGSEGLSVNDAVIDDGTSSALLAPARAGAIGRANAWGLRDMHGNVWEWCADWSSPYTPGVVTDPTGPADSQMNQSELALKTVRGGGWNASASHARSANRWENSPAAATDYIGFRVALEVDLTAP